MKGRLTMCDPIQAVVRLCSPFALLCALGLMGCASAHGPKDSTETGNPPVIDPKVDTGRIALVVRATGVHITGDAGAVTPGRAEVEITDVVSGEVTKVTAKADGSFDAQVNGSQDDV